ncbi:thioredoxin-like domain-containing protein [Polaribacter sp. IC073]|uniref:thioredoxin-like domain-containing protein n=1 Tax=Polaribacter sp. IC073 TaxID=2508540 RepID=UPI00167BA2D3|nr:thioredoxin-like domain-containing protein [Polaribacter sp. IC073]
MIIKDKNYFQLMRIKLSGSKPIIGLLPIILVVLFSCNIEKRKGIPKIDKQSIKSLDTIVLLIKINGSTETGLNSPNIYLNNDFVEFKNETTDSIQITRYVARVFKNLVFQYKAYVFNNGSLKNIEQTYLVEKNMDTLKLVYNSKESTFDPNENEITKFYLDYKNIRIKIFKDKGRNNSILKSELDSIYNIYNMKYNKIKNETLLRLNTMHYYDKLQMLYINETSIDFFIKSIDEPIGSTILNSLLFNYTKNRIKNIEYEKLNSKNYSKNYLNLLALGHFSFLRSEDNKGDIKYLQAINWLKTTDLYKKDSVFIKKKIIPLNNLKFKENLRALNFFDINTEKNSITEILKKHHANYYLLDFWATWCAPCIRGVKEMREMDLPKNIKIISISLDKKKDKEKWISKTKELKQSYTYWLDESSVTGKSFLKFIELQSIPRYILIDKKMNLIDQAFFHPSEPQFLLKLKDVKNYKFW